MSNFKITARPAARIRSVAAWDRVRATYDMIIGASSPDNYWKFDVLVSSEAFSYDGRISVSSPNNYWKLDELVSSILASYDVKVTSSSPDNYWKMDEVKGP